MRQSRKLIDNTQLKYLIRNETSSSRHFPRHNPAAASWSLQSPGRDTSPFLSRQPSCLFSRARQEKRGERDRVRQRCTLTQRRQSRPVASVVESKRRETHHTRTGRTNERTHDHDRFKRKGDDGHIDTRIDERTNDESPRGVPRLTGDCSRLPCQPAG